VDERWQTYWIDDGPEDTLLFYCGECAEREFGAQQPARDGEGRLA